jgi:hypothetical protein
MVFSPRSPLASEALAKEDRETSASSFFSRFSFVSRFKFPGVVLVAALLPSPPFPS